MNVGGFIKNGKFHEIKITKWNTLKAKLWLWWRGWNFVYVNRDEFLLKIRKNSE